MGSLRGRTPQICFPPSQAVAGGKMGEFSDSLGEGKATS